MIIRWLFRGGQYVTGYLYIGWLFWQQQRFAKRLLSNILIDSRLQGDGSFSKEASHRLRYYGSMVPVVIGDTLHLLGGKPMPDQTRKAVTLYGFFTPLFDDWFDAESPNTAQAKERIFHPETIEQTNDLSRVTYTVLSNLLQHASAFSLGWETPASEVIHAQIDSLAQLNKQTPITQIRDITWQKGGASVLGVRHFLPTSISSAEREVCMQLGGMMQYLDDVFDVYTDLQSGIRTLATECLDFNALSKDYNNEVNKLHQLLMQLPYKTYYKKQVWKLWQLMWVRGTVCIEQLQQLNNQSLSKCTRKQLVCDMAKWPNIWRTWIVFLNSTN